jgi:Mn2+/Fe2+ NRAMP family transporter
VVATLTTDVLRVVACYMYLISVCGPRIHWDAALTAVVVVGVAAGVDDAAEPPVM